jgi:hypothetical protein
MSERIVSVNVINRAKDWVQVGWQMAGNRERGRGGGGGTKGRDISPQQQITRGYSVYYQAVGSSVRQQSDVGQPDITECTITNLHENTHYEVCVQQYLTNTSLPLPELRCIEVITATDSMAVALGTGFGAVATLTLVAFLVFVAKWQHKLTLRKQRHLQTTASLRQDVLLLPDDDDVIFASRSSQRCSEALTRAVWSRSRNEIVVLVESVDETALNSGLFPVPLAESGGERYAGTSNRTDRNGSDKI